MNYRFNKFELNIGKLRPLFFLEEYIYLNLNSYLRVIWILLYSAILKSVNIMCIIIFRISLKNMFDLFFSEL